MSRLALLLCLCFVITPASALEWANLWSSPEQRAKKKLDAQEYDALIEQAPDALWRGLGEYQNGNYTAAIESFAEQRAKEEETERYDALERASFNQATSLVHAGEYEQALSLFDDILSNNAEHQNALHNRDIAQQLQELEQEQQQQEQEGEEQEQSDSEDSQNNDQQNESSEEGEGSKESSEKSDEQSSEQGESEGSEQSDSEQSDSQQSEQQQAEEEEQAARAMQAERQRESGDEQQQDAEGNVVETKPLTEREQANEQWLRQIPDDPVGLLERKIQNRHTTDFPKVEHSDKPW